MEIALQEWFKSLPTKSHAKGLSRYRHIDQWGPWRDRDISWPGGGGPRYDVPHPGTKKPCKVPERGWGFATPKAMQTQIDLGLVIFREDHTEPPFRKAHLRPIPEELGEEEVFDEEKPEPEDQVGMQVMPSVLYKQSQVTIKAFRDLMGDRKFDNPKDKEVIGRVIRYVTGGDKEAVFLDSFAGSATTAHAVLELNKEDGGNRRFILVECEDYADSITAERVRRVVKGVSTAKDESLKKGLGGTFSFFELGKPIELESILDGDDLPSYKELARYVFYTATGEEFDEKKVNQKQSFIGESRNYQVYLFYVPKVEVLKGMAFTLDNAKALPPLKEGKRRLIFAPTKYLDQDHLDRYRIDFDQLPFEIYELTR
jgi:adenine-specific DNA-methyltransferase